MSSAIALLNSTVPPSAVVRQEFSHLGQALLNRAKAQVGSDPVRAKRYCYSALSFLKRIIKALNEGTNSAVTADPNKRIMEMLAEGQARNSYKILLTILREEGGNSTELLSVEEEQKTFLASVKFKQKSYSSQ
jgi:hypothetical protein